MIFLRKLTPELPWGCIARSLKRRRLTSNMLNSNWSHSNGDSKWKMNYRTIHCWCSSICHGTKEKMSDAIVILPSRSLSANEMRPVEDGGLGESMGHSHTGVTQQRDPDLEGKVSPGLPSWKGWLFRGRRVSSFNFNLLASWKESYDQPRQHIKKQRHHFANKGPHRQSYGFSSSHE